MKRYLLIVLAVLILSCFLIACDPNAGDDKSDDPSPIVGAWTCNVGGTTWNLKFNADGSYTIADGDNVESFEGKYSLEGNKWIGTVTNLSDFFPFYTSDDPCYAYRDEVDATHWKLAFDEVFEDPLDYRNTYEWDADKQIYFIDESVDPDHYDYESFKIGDTSYEYNSTTIRKDGSGNEMYKLEITMIAKAESVAKTAAVEKVFAKFYDYDTSKSYEKLTVSYKLDGDTLTFWWLGTERNFTRK